MKRLTTTLLITSLAIGGMAIAGTGMARHGDGHGPCSADGMQGRKHRHGFGHAGRGFSAIMQLEQNLDLNREQRTAVREILKNARTARRSHRDKLIDNRLALHDLMEADVFNDQEARKLAEIQADNLAGLLLLHARTRAGIRAQLTDAQREKLAELRQNHAYGYGFGRH